ncbi:MAG: bilirubin oxidase [Spirochaetes bacterium DG_61]|nr:MAG: bilirubin oxidase [Spirochaetes bacterium DG_61]
MDITHKITRREFLRTAAFGSLVFFSSSVLRSTKVFGQSGSIDAEPDLVIELRSVLKKVPLLPGPETAFWCYEGKVLKGDSSVIQQMEGSYLGPTLHLRRRQKVRIIYKNEINEPSIIHWHGLHLPEEMDGHPRFVIPHGEIYTYEFEVKNRAGTYWYHPHPHRRTGPQVYGGLAGLLIVHDEEEEKADLPSGIRDIPIVLQDRTFDDQNQLVYLTSMMDQMNGFLGNRIFVNGRPDRSISVESAPHRLRILNGSNSRIFKLAFSPDIPLTVIGTDGGLLERPVELPYAVLGPGERLDLWVDFQKVWNNSEFVLKSLPFFTGASGMMRGMHGRGMMGPARSTDTLPSGTEFDILRFRIRPGSKGLMLPQRLSRMGGHSIDEAINRNSPRRFSFSMQGMRPTINGRLFELNGVTDEETVRLNTTEVWEFHNTTGMGMMGMPQMAHPVHIHGLQFQVINRNVYGSDFETWESLKDGFVDSGWKDTVLLLPGMAVKILLKFEDHAGLFLYHCHNLEHEDLGMMRNYLIRS